jgi:hypothetical protein
MADRGIALISCWLFGTLLLLLYDVSQHLQNGRISSNTPQVLENRTQVIQRARVILILQPLCRALKASINKRGRLWLIPYHAALSLCAAHQALRPNDIGWFIASHPTALHQFPLWRS